VRRWWWVVVGLCLVMTRPHPLSCCLPLAPASAPSLLLDPCRKKQKGELEEGLGLIKRSALRMSDCAQYVNSAELGSLYCDQSAAASRPFDLGTLGHARLSRWLPPTVWVGLCTRMDHVSMHGVDARLPLLTV
jgi:hypothetical protein